MPPRHVPTPTNPPEQSIALLREKLSELQQLKGRQFLDVEMEEKEWQHLTNVIIEKAFDNTSANPLKFQTALNAGNDRVVLDVSPTVGPSGTVASPILNQLSKLASPPLNHY